jgi:acyl carrier protein
MDQIAARLVNCFQTVFPNVPGAKIPSVSQDSVAEWDSIAAITLINVIEEEFGIEVDLDLASELDSFDRVHEYLQKEMQVS